jgi:hypothetical protein
MKLWGEIKQGRFALLKMSLLPGGTETALWSFAQWAEAEWEGVEQHKKSWDSLTNDDLTPYQMLRKQHSSDFLVVAYRHFMAMRTARQDWDPSALINHILSRWEQIRKRHRNHVLVRIVGLSIKSRDMWKEFPHVQAGLWYLKKWRKLRVCRLLAYKVAGHYLPPELVECIEQELYDTTSI